MTIVTIDSWMPLKEKNELSAIPVMIPGSASGSTRKNEIASRPKKRKPMHRVGHRRARAPSRSAVAASPTLTDSMKAWRTCGSFQATENQCSVKLEIGQLSMIERSKA